MPSLRDLVADQIGEVLAAAAERQVPVVVTVNCGDHWTNLPSRLIGLGAGYCWLEMPGPDRTGQPYQFEVTDQVAVNFKLKHYKYLFTATVAEIRQLSHGDSAAEAMCVYIPEKMQRISRRAFERVDIPANRILRVSFWQGGQRAEPKGPSPQKPVFLGTVTNLSAGGFRVRTEAGAAELFEVGDVTGVRMAFGPGGESFYADAQFRYVNVEDDNTVQMGFQFVGLGRTEEGRGAIQLIGRKVAEFQNQAKCAVSASTN